MDNQDKGKTSILGRSASTSFSPLKSSPWVSAPLLNLLLADCTTESNFDVLIRIHACLTWPSGVKTWLVPIIIASFSSCPPQPPSQHRGLSHKIIRMAKLLLWFATCILMSKAWAFTLPSFKGNHHHHHHHHASSAPTSWSFGSRVSVMHYRSCLPSSQSRGHVMS